MPYEIIVDSNLYTVYPQIRLGLLTFDADVEDSKEIFWDYMHECVLPNVKTQIEGKEWNEIPGVKGSRAAYKAFGRNPGRYRVSSEALLRRVRRDDELYHINSVVDVNNLVSVKSGLSVGSYDLDQIEGSIVFRKAEKGEGYTGIGKSFLDMENMLVLADQKGMFGSSMSDSTRAMVTKETKRVLVVVYCFEDDIDLEKLLEDAKISFKTYASISNMEVGSYKQSRLAPV